MELRRQKQQGGWKVELVDGERSVSRLWIADRRMRVGHVALRVGGIAGVGTERSYRKKGLASRVLNDALDLMRHEGYDMSFLFGIQDFYHRFGFATCMPERLFSLDTRDAERIKKAPAMRRLRHAEAGNAEIRQIRSLYNRLNKSRTASVVRQADWRGFPMAAGFGVDPQVYVWDRGKGKIGAYAVCDDRQDRCRAAEVGAESAEGMAAIVRLLARRAVALRRERVQVCMPIDSEFALFCRQLGIADETRYERNAGPMARIIDLQSTLAKLGPLFEQRWQSGKQLSLQSDIGNLRLVRKEGGIEIKENSPKGRGVRLRQDALSQAILGYRSVGDLVLGSEVQAKQTEQKILEQLFPVQEGHMSWPDRF